VDVLKTSRSEWKHIIREALRNRAWRWAAKRRRDMCGIENGIDREASTSLLADSKLDVRSKGWLRTIMSGGVWTQERAARAKLSESAICPYCSAGEVEDHDHLWWHCSAWERIRSCHPNATNSFSLSWPACLRICGLMPVHTPPLRGSCAQPADLVGPSDGPKETLDDCISVASSSSSAPMMKARSSEHKLGTDCDHISVVSSTESAGPSKQVTEITERHELSVDGCIVVFTDGACRGNQNKYARQAGCGAFWAAGHPFNVSEPLDGTEHTNNRAELMAVLRVLQLELRAVEIRSDSAYVVNGMNKNFAKWRRHGFHNKAGRIKNWDLWKRVDELLQDRVNPAKFTKIWGHASSRDILTGRVQLIDKLGNDNADALAVAGALRRTGTACGEVRQQCVLTTAAVQRMMVDIAIARETRRTAQLRQGSFNEDDSDSLGGASDMSFCTRSSWTSACSSRRSVSSEGRRRGRSAPAASE
jgi:ribonuclease HI